jgi:hypothetical protein
MNDGVSLAVGQMGVPENETRCAASPGHDPLGALHCDFVRVDPHKLQIQKACAINILTSSAVCPAGTP